MEDIQELKNQLAELQEKIEKLENKKENKRWRAEKGENYYFLGRDNKVNWNVEDGDKLDNFYFKKRNYFKTAEEANEYQEKINTYYELIDFAEELSRENPVDWNNENQPKYYICYSFAYKDIYQALDYTDREIGQIYCTNFDYAEKATDKFGKVKLKKLFI